MEPSLEAANYLLIAPIISSGKSDAISFFKATSSSVDIVSVQNKEQQSHALSQASIFLAEIGSFDRFNQTFKDGRALENESERTNHATRK